MKTKTGGAYMFIDSPNSLFGPHIRYADTIKRLKLLAWEKTAVKRGECALFAVRNGKIVRINVNGSIR